MIAVPNLFGLDPSRPGLWFSWRTRQGDNDIPVLATEMQSAVFEAFIEVIREKRVTDPETVTKLFAGSTARRAAALFLGLVRPWPPSSAGLLGDFLGLFNATSYKLAPDAAWFEGAAGEDIGALSRELRDLYLFLHWWGPLELCPHLWPAGHCAAELRDAIPLEAVRGYVRICRALLSLGAAASIGGDAALARRYVTGLSALTAAVESFSQVEPGENQDKQLVANTLSHLLHTSRAYPTVYWFGASPQLVNVSQSPLLTTIILQLVDAIAQGESFIECSNPECQRHIDMRLRRRKPLPGTAPWCDECRTRGVHKRDSERRLRDDPENRKYRIRKDQTNGRDD